MAANPGKRFSAAPAHPRCHSQRRADLRAFNYTQLDRTMSYKWNAGKKDGKYFSMPWDSRPVVL
jgi:hypothetical protein